MTGDQQLPTVEHAGFLDDLTEIPGYLLPEPGERRPLNGHYSCSYCGVGDSGSMLPTTPPASSAPAPVPGRGTLRAVVGGETIVAAAALTESGRLEIATGVALCARGAVFSAELELGGVATRVVLREVDRALSEHGHVVGQSFVPYRSAMSITDSVVKASAPTGGCVKLKLSAMRQRPVFPIHVAPTALDRATGRRREIGYREAMGRFADLVLAHLGASAQTLVYACGQLDYFSIFALQEVFRLLGVRNLTGNAEHCLNSGAVFNEMLTGQEAPLMTFDLALRGPNRFYLFNGWNGVITHPPVFRELLARPDLDAYLIEVAVTESAKALAAKLGPERVLLIRPRGDPHLALAVAHELLTSHPQALQPRFVDRFADADTFAGFAELARSPRFAPERVAERLAPEPGYAERLLKGIRMIALKLARADLVPVNMPSVGLSQTSGVVAHCLWGDVFAMLGKYGLNADGTLAGGTMRVAGQINAESEVQGCNRKYFMGRIRMEDAVEAARRMHLPDDAYQPVVDDAPRAALDYSDLVPGRRELFICFGTQFESNMIGRARWIRKLTHESTRLVVVDPVADPFSVQHADLIIPAPPHPAATKLYQNGEWKLSLSIPQKRAAPETRSDATIIYDLGAEIAGRLERDPALAAAHPHIARHARSGYMQQRFGAGLPRVGGEVSRPVLWDRVQDYMGGGRGPLYCRPEHADGRPIRWSELLDRGAIIYGGVGQSRGRLDYDAPDARPYADIYRRPRKFTFFVPTEADLAIPEGIILNNGRGSLSDDPERVRFATATFNSGKATPAVNMPDENPLYVSPSLAARHDLKTGDRVKVTGRLAGESIVLPVAVSDRVKGDTAYVSFHKTRAEIERGVYFNSITSHEGRCPYSSQTNVKLSQVVLEPERAAVVAPARPDPTHIDPRIDLPIWTGQETPLFVTDIIEETHDVTTYRFQGHPLCRFAYWPGQFCTLVLNIDGQKVVRSYSISSAPTRPFALEITVKRVKGGLVSNWLAESVKIGDRIEVSGPKGRFCLVPGKIPKKMLFLAAGSGVTPLLSMARWLCDVSADVDILFFDSVQTPRDVICQREIELMTARHRIFKPIIFTTTRQAGGVGWTGMSGRISRPVLEMIAPDLHERHVYMCGPPGFMEAVKGLLHELRFDLANLHLESFGGVRTSVADKLAPLGASAPAPVVVPAPAATPAPFQVEFARSGKTARTDGRMPLLDLAEAHDVGLDYGCRAGSCGDCKARLLRGRVEMECEDGLNAADKAAGFVLTCVARPREDCSLDA